jgi:hypothetical protein
VERFEEAFITRSWKKSTLVQLIFDMIRRDVNGPGDLPSLQQAVCKTGLLANTPRTICYIRQHVSGNQTGRRWMGARNHQRHRVRLDAA